MFFDDEEMKEIDKLMNSNFKNYNSCGKPSPTKKTIKKKSSIRKKTKSVDEIIKGVEL